MDGYEYMPLSIIPFCIQCIISRNSERIQWLLLPVLHWEKLNELLYDDMVCMGPAEQRSLKNVLIVKNDTSSYTWLYTCDNMDSDNATARFRKHDDVLRWNEWLTTSHNSHFKDSVLKNLAYDVQIKHYLTT